MNETEVPEIDVHEARRRVDGGSAFVDVREESEYEEVRAPGAKLVPMSSFVERYEDEIPSDREVVLLCRSGARSGRAAAFLRGQGIDAVNVAGGIVAWEEEGLPVERG